MITHLCIKGGVKFNEEEERCPKASLLTLSRALKAPVESEKGERKENTRKRKRVNTEVPKEPTFTAVAEEEASREERGGFEAYSKQPMLSSTADQATPAPTRVEERGKQRAETKANNNSKLRTLLKEMKEEMREMDEQVREELRWKDNHIKDQIKKRENSLAVALQQRDEE